MMKVSRLHMVVFSVLLGSSLSANAMTKEQMIQQAKQLLTSSTSQQIQQKARQAFSNLKTVPIGQYRFSLPEPEFASACLTLPPPIMAFWSQLPPKMPGGGSPVQSLVGITAPLNINPANYNVTATIMACGAEIVTANKVARTLCSVVNPISKLVNMPSSSDGMPLSCSQVVGYVADRSSSSAPNANQQVEEQFSTPSSKNDTNWNIQY